MKAICISALLVLGPVGPALDWGQKGHSIVAEIAQRRLSPDAWARISTLFATATSYALPCGTGEPTSPGWRNNGCRARMWGPWALEAHKIAIDDAFTVPMDADLGEDYLKLAQPMVDQQLAVAGLRLARTLNDIFR